MNPVTVKVVGKKFLFIKWDDDTESKIGLGKLRRLCPCATCVALRENESKSYIPLFAADQVNVSSINIVGNYAISILWKDGHNTGIYEYPFLKNLAKD